MTPRRVEVTPEIREYIRMILADTREPLRECVLSQSYHLDEVFGYVSVPPDELLGKEGGLVTVLPLDAREAILKLQDPADEYSRLFAGELRTIDAEPAQGRLRTLIETPRGIFQVAVQIHQGAMA